MERVFRRVIRYNVSDICQKILCPVCKSLMNPSSEENALNNFFNQMKSLEKSPVVLKIPNYPDLRKLGVFGGTIIIRSSKSHRKIVYFFPTGLVKPIGAESSDIVVLVTHEIIKPDFKVLVNEKISLFQVKLETGSDLFRIKTRQWHLMRYWPDFYYRGRVYSLLSCRRIPDVCSFFLLLFKGRSFDDKIFSRFGILNCRVNSISLSTPYMEEKVPLLRNIPNIDLLNDRYVPLRSNLDGDGFFGLLWCLLLAYLGVHDTEGLTLMKVMFPELFDTDPEEKEEIERPSIGVHIRIQLKAE